MDGNEINTTGMYVVRLVQRLKDGQYYIEKHELLAPTINIGGYHVGEAYDCEGPFNWNDATEALRRYIVPAGFHEVLRNLQEIYYIRDYDFEEYREWICNTREAISRDDLIEEILIQMGSVPNVEE